MLGAVTKSRGSYVCHKRPTQKLRGQILWSSCHQVNKNGKDWVQQQPNDMLRQTSGSYLSKNTLQTPAAHIDSVEK